MKKISEAAMNIDGQPMFKYLDRAKKLESEGKKMIHLEIGDPDFDTPSNVTMAAIKALGNGKTHYTSSWGDPDFRDAIKNTTFWSRGFIPEDNQILVTPGANICIFYAMFVLCEKGDEVILPDPGFATYYSSAKMLGLKQVRAQLKEENGFRMQAKDVEDLITDKTRLLIINSPSNPTGAVMTEQELKDIYELCVKHDIYLYTDEIYSRLIFDGSEFSSPSKYDNCKSHVILSNGFSKGFAMTGWRLGTLIGPENVIDRIRALLETTSSCVSPFIQAAGIECINGPKDQINSMINEYKQRRDILISGLNMIEGFTCDMPGGAFYAFPNISGTGLSDVEVSEQLMDKAGVVTLPGSCFGEYGSNNIRLCYANSRRNICDALVAINEWTKSL